jgi:LmbE family N-acetylglucosaminyl deacetylase
MRLIAVMAHPDDAEIWCGGTLILHAEKGDAVRICVFSYEMDSLRGKEAQEGARLMGCEVELLGLEDTAIRDTDESADLLVRSLSSFRPDTIISHLPDDVHPDHEGVTRILRRALIRLQLKTPANEVKKVPRIFCCDTYGSIGLKGPFVPNKFVDVTSVWEKKIAAIHAHKSEPIEYYLYLIEKQCHAHGKSAGTEKAEGFLYMPVFGIPDLGEPL